jgi:hypothetical protein
VDQQKFSRVYLSRVGRTWYAWVIGGALAVLSVILLIAQSRPSVWLCLAVLFGGAAAVQVPVARQFWIDRQEALDQVGAAEREPDLGITPQLEHGDWAVKMGASLQVWRHGAFAWVWVKNHGPTANFAAQVVDVRGVPESWGDYKVAEPAWDGKHSAIIEIPKGHERKLRLASVLRKPRGFWFWTSEGQNEVPGWPWPLADDEFADIEFRLEVTNTNTGHTTGKQGRITVPLDTAEAEFTLEDG